MARTTISQNADGVLVRPCSKCKIIKPLTEYPKDAKKKCGVRSRCIECSRKKYKQYDAIHKEKRQAYQKANPEKGRQATRRHRAKYIEKARESGKLASREFRRVNPEKCRKYERNRKNKEERLQKSREHYQKNKSKHVEYSKRWRADHIEYVREYTRRQLALYEQKHPGWGAAKARKRRALKKQCGGSHTAREFIVICEKYGNKCLACGATGKLTADHIVPISKGGSNSIDNIQPLCLSCNSSKNNKVIDYRPF